MAQREEEDVLKMFTYLSGQTNFEVIEKKPAEDEADQRCPVFPLLDRHAQRGLRRKVVMEQLGRV